MTPEEKAQYKLLEVEEQKNRFIDQIKVSRESKEE
jgi:hypothetical protein